MSTLGLLVAGACTTEPALRCRGPEHTAVMESVFFGTGTPDGPVTAAEWQDFLEAVITPRLPDGLTSWGAAGQWRNAKGDLEKESAYVLHVVHPDAAPEDKAIGEVITLYKEHFRQQAVLRVRTQACMSF